MLIIEKVNYVVDVDIYEELKQIIYLDSNLESIMYLI
jgi:hypothetical protein